jgi:hypothetical protein
LSILIVTPSATEDDGSQGNLKGAVSIQRLKLKISSAVKNKSLMVAQ